jgi:Bcr/CflA subfamily drug resistance transporter
MEQFKLNISNQSRIIWILLLLMPVIGMAIDLISPSLPAIQTSLKTSTTFAKDTISFYLLGYACGNFIIGLLTDSWGRRKPLCFNMLIFIIASLLPIFYPNIQVLLIARVIQGLSMGGIAVASRAIFSDILAPNQMIKMGIVIGSMFGLGPVIGPFLGGYLQYYYGWHACFIFFAGIMLLIYLLVLAFVPETHQNRHPLKMKVISKNIHEILANQKFVGLTIIMGLVYSGGIAFNVVGPFLVQGVLHHDAIFFGHIALGMGIIFLLATFICRVLSNRLSSDNLISYGLNFGVIVIICITLITYFSKSSMLFLIISSSLMLFLQGFIFPISMGKGISLFRHISGTATAIMYLINILITSVTSFILSFLNIHTVFLLACVYLCIAILAKLIAYKSRCLI